MQRKNATEFMAYATKLNREPNDLLPLLALLEEDEREAIADRRASPEEKADIKAFAASLNGQLTTDLTGRDLVAKAIENGINVRMNRGVIVTAGKEIKTQLRLRDQRDAALIKPKK